MITSIAVLLGGIAMYYFKTFWVDSILSILIVVYLVYLSWGLLMQTLRILMQFTPPDIDLKAIENEILNFPAIENIHHVHVWQLSDKEIHLEAHIDFSRDLKLSKATEITRQVVKLLKDKFEITHAILQPEIGSDDPKQIIVDDR